MTRERSPRPFSIATMVRASLVLAASTLLGLASCAHEDNQMIELRPEARNVRVLCCHPKDDLLAGCEPRGPVEGYSYAGLYVEAARAGAENDIRNRAAALGANVVVVTKSDSWGEPTRAMTSGKAYRCANPAEAAAHVLP